MGTLAVSAPFPVGHDSKNTYKKEIKSLWRQHGVSQELSFLHAACAGSVRWCGGLVISRYIHLAVSFLFIITLISRGPRGQASVRFYLA